MTISVILARRDFSGDGTTSEFSTGTMKFYDSSTLLVEVYTVTNGATTTLAEGTHYTVSGGNGAVGSVHLDGGTSPWGAPDTGANIAIVRSEPYTQLSNPENGDPSDADVIEARFDKITMQVQQLLEKFDRAILLDDIEDGTTISQTIPYDRASQFLAFDANKNVIALTGNASADISNFMYTVVTAASASEVRSLLGLVIGTDVQAYDADLATIAGLTHADGNIIVSDGTAWTTESGDTARTSLGVGTGDSPTFTSATFSTTEAIGFPDGTTAQRPATASTSMARFNTTLNAPEFYDGSSWRVCKTTGKQIMWVPAGAWIPNTTNGAPVTDVETTTNAVMLRALAFDSATTETAQFPIKMPSSWDEGTLEAYPVWTAQSGSGTFIAGFAALATGEGDALDAAFGGAQTSTDTLTTALDHHASPATAGITPSGTAAADDMVTIKMYRDVANDTLSADALVLGVWFLYSDDAASEG